jgi:hypothetical protein
MVPPRTEFYSEPLDMEGNTRLVVEARVLAVPGHPPAAATVEVHGTDDGIAEGNIWVIERHRLTLDPGAWERCTYPKMRQYVRVKASAMTLDGKCSVEIRLTRLP